MCIPQDFERLKIANLTSDHSSIGNNVIRIKNAVFREVIPPRCQYLILIFTD
jgi:hypothetical protein